MEADLSDRSTGYLTVTTGFKSGGLNEGVGGFPTFSPEHVTNYELGLKNRLFGDQLTLNGAVFYEDYTNLQVTQLRQFSGSGGGGQTVTTNAAKAAIYGAEFEWQWNMTQADHLSGFFNYLHATFTNYTNAIDEQFGATYPDLKHRTLPNSPRTSLRVQYSHNFSLENGDTLIPLAALYWQSKSYLRGFDLPVDTVPSYTKTDLSLTYATADGHWNAVAYVHNLEDKVVRNGSFTLVGHYFSDYNPPRTYGLRLSYQY